MTPNAKWRWFLLVLPLLGTSILSCRNTPVPSIYQEPPPDLKPMVIPYVEEEGFDTVFESALLSQNPVILIQTQTPRPDWGPHLNAWIAAWNRGGRVVEGPRLKVRMQAPLSPVTVNAETLREFHLLIDDLMNRVEDLARRGSSWWEEERTQRRRVALLKPYSLRFNLDSNSNIQLIFFHGKYSQYYRQFIESIAIHEVDGPAEWSRCVKCSRCKGSAAAPTVREDGRPTEHFRGLNSETNQP
jgi:hypothetical protein